MSTGTSNSQAKAGQTYEAGCHCGFIKFSVTVSPPLPETKPLACDCSACRRFGYLLVYMRREDVKWHGDSWARLSRYQFNTKEKDQLFCAKCGASIGIDFRDFYAPKPSILGISVRTFDGIDLNGLEYKHFQGSEKVAPAGDLSGTQYDLDLKTAEREAHDKAEQEIAVAAEIA